MKSLLPLKVGRLHINSIDDGFLDWPGDPHQFGADVLHPVFVLRPYVLDDTVTLRAVPHIPIGIRVRKDVEIKTNVVQNRFDS